MRNTILGIVALLLVAGGGWYVYQNRGNVAVAGEYAYVCDNGSEFSMTPSADMSSITVYAGSQGMFTGAITLNKMGDGNHYESGPAGALVVLSGAGEEVQLAVGQEATACNPVPSQTMAPWNWGDAGEGGSIKPDVRLVVGESIMGTWKSSQDGAFVREFKDFSEASLSGTVVDRHSGAQVSSGTYAVFTKDNPVPGVTIPLEDSAVYVRLTMSGTQADTLNFKLTKLTPETLELVYLDRGGVQTYTLVQ